MHINPIKSWFSSLKWPCLPARRRSHLARGWSGRTRGVWRDGAESDLAKRPSWENVECPWLSTRKNFDWNEKSGEIHPGNFDWNETSAEILNPKQAVSVSPQNATRKFLVVKKIMGRYMEIRDWICSNLNLIRELKVGTDKNVGM